MSQQLDKEISRLEIELEDAAAFWRGTYSDEAIQEYHEIMKRLYDLGWNGRLAIQSLLPAELMPEEYIKRNGTF